MTVRPMNPEESKATTAIARSCFGGFGMLFFDLGTHTLVCVEHDRILGGAALGVFTAGKHLCGVVKWIFTAPDAQGRGVANRLLAEALRWFDTHGCTDVVACIEGHNTASSNRFADAGFFPVGFGTQAAHFGFALPRVWLGSFHLMDIGHFLWMRNAGSQSPQAGWARGSAAWVVTVLVNLLIVAGATVRTAGIAALSAERWLTLLGSIALLFGVRVAAMALAAKAVNLPLHFRPWETGLVLSSLVGGVFGGVFPVPGSLYPRQIRWRYRELLPRLGPVAAAGAGALVVLGWGLWAATRVINPLAVWYAPLAGAAALARVMLLFEVLLPFFPLACYNGRRVLDWKPIGWAVIAAATVALLIAGR